MNGSRGQPSGQARGRRPGRRPKMNDNFRAFFEGVCFWVVVLKRRLIRS